VRATSPSNAMSHGPRPTCVPSGILIHAAVWPQQTWTGKWGWGLSLLGELSPRLTQCRWSEANFSTKWHLDPSSHLATTDMGRKLGGCAPLGELGPYLTQCRPGPTCLPSGILIHPAVWPQQSRAENWGAMNLWGGRGLGPHLTQCGQGRGLLPCQVSS